MRSSLRQPAAPAAARRAAGAAGAPAARPPPLLAPPACSSSGRDGGASDAGIRRASYTAAGATRRGDGGASDAGARRASYAAAPAATRRGALLSLVAAPPMAATAAAAAAMLLLSSAAAAPPRAGAAVIDEDVAQRVYAGAAASVASIAVLRPDGAGGDTAEGVGTGFVWDSYGHVVTSYRCASRVTLEKSKGIVVSLGAGGPGATFSAAVVAADASADVAVLRLAGSAEALAALAPLPLGASGSLRIGQSLLALSRPPGPLPPAMSAGLMSGTNRSVPSPAGGRIYGALQTDAAVGAYGSGGPLLDSSGRVVGTISAAFGAASSGRGAGTNFALPVDSLRVSVPNLIVYGNAAGKGV